MPIAVVDTLKEKMLVCSTIASWFQRLPGSGLLGFTCDVQMVRWSPGPHFVGAQACAVASSANSNAEIPAVRIISCVKCKSSG